VNLGEVKVNMGNNLLVNVVFSIQTHPTVVQRVVSVKPSELNLNKLFAGSNGSISNLSTIAITDGGEYLFQLVNATELEKYFPTFYAVVTISNSSEKIGVMVGYSNNSLLPLMDYNNGVYLSPGTYKVNVTLYYFLYSNVTPVRFSSTIIEIDYTPLASANFIIQPTAVQIGTGMINSKGIAVITLKSNGNVEIVKAQIVGTNISVNTASITSYQLTAGINTVTINFSSASSQLQPDVVYTIALTLSDGETIEAAAIAE